MPNLDDEDEDGYEVNVNVLPPEKHIAMDIVDNIFLKTVGEVVKHYFEYGKTMYGNQWWDDDCPNVSAAFGLKKFAMRLFKVFVSKTVEQNDRAKLKSDCIDAATYALFLVALRNKSSDV